MSAPPPTPPPPPSTAGPAKAPFVFLGGSCGATTWRQDIAMPLLEKNGITFYNPQVADWNPSLVEKEKVAKAGARVLVFVISRQTSSTATMIEVAYYIGLRRNGLFLQADAVLGQAKAIAPADVNRARAYLVDVAKLEGVHLPEAIANSNSVVVMMQASYLIGAKKHDVLAKMGRDGGGAEDGMKTRELLEELARRAGLTLFEDVTDMMEHVVMYYQEIDLPGGNLEQSREPVGGARPSWTRFIHPDDALHGEIVQRPLRLRRRPAELLAEHRRGDAALQLLRQLDHLILVEVQLAGGRLDDGGAPALDQLNAIAEDGHLLDGPLHVVHRDVGVRLGAGLARAQQPLVELADVHDAAGAVVERHADLHHLDGQLVVDVADAEHLRPEVGARVQRVDAHVGAHHLEGAPELRVLADVLLVLDGELLQLLPEDLHLLGELRQLLLGNLGALLLVLRLGLLLLLNGAHAAQSESLFICLRRFLRRRPQLRLHISLESAVQLEEDALALVNQRQWPVKLHQSASVQDHHSIVVNDGVQSVGDGEHCLLRELRANSRLDEGVSARVDVGCG
ncbi:hypothetical protein TYRP_020468 [Tyrophagus putrescentiae]|nr:hypothetical protein TYRP_020468 [Tyrophagus putrescentiae]